MVLVLVLVRGLWCMETALPSVIGKAGRRRQEYPLSAPASDATVAEATGNTAEHKGIMLLMRLLLLLCLPMLGTAMFEPTPPPGGPGTGQLGEGLQDAATVWEEAAKSGNGDLAESAAR